MCVYGDKERTKDFEYFLENYNKFYKDYGHKFIVIRNEQVIGVYESAIDAINNTSKTHPIGTFIVQECNGDESGYTNYVSSWQLISI